MAILHITNGDGAANLIKASGISGDVLPWRDPMHHGPFPAGLTLGELGKVRAKYLSQSPEDVRKTEAAFRQRDDALRRSSEHEGVVLWFEHDLLDQLQILQILDWFSDQELGETTLEVICINEFPGCDLFRGIGQLRPDDMLVLYENRVPVTTQMLQVARAGWDAFRSDCPGDLVEFIGGGLAPLPFLKDALIRHLEEYPSPQTGLSRTEVQLMELVQNGVTTPQDLFLQNMDLETALFIGDWRTFRVLNRLRDHGLLEMENQQLRYDAAEAEERQAYRQQSVTLTAKAVEALRGGIDPESIIEKSAWLGGVQITMEKVSQVSEALNHI